MLMLTRVESDHQAFEIASIDVADVVRSCAEAQRAGAEAKRIKLVAEANGHAEGGACRVRADREALREILDNLVDNAIKYTPEGGSVTIAWRRREDARSEERGASGEMGVGSGEQAIQSIESEHPASSNQDPASNIQHPTSSILLSVTDTGIGIKPQDQERIFERFYRVDKARSRELGGTGLGLSIVKHLAQAFGGRVAVESTPGQGSVFTVELPVG
jgi:two-component system phosphate regulon sensor histidine kinase PhoR